MVKHILIGGIVGAAVMAIGLIVLPQEPVFTALSMALGFVAGNLTWRPANIPVPRFIAACAGAGVLAFAVIWGALSRWS